LLGRLSGGNLLASIGKFTGLDQVGAALTGGAGRADFFEGGLTVTSQKVVRDQIEQGFRDVADAAVTGGNLTAEAILESDRKTREAVTTAKDDRLPEATTKVNVEINPISLDDAKYKLEEEGKKAGKAYIDGLKAAYVGGRSDIEGLNAEFGERLNQFIQDASRQGQKINIFSAHRNLEHQADLYWKKVSSLVAKGMSQVEAQQAARKWVAFPNPNAPHVKGIAADLKFGSDAAKKWAHDMAESYGLVFRMSHEGWHIELADQSKVADSRERQLEKIQQLQAAGETETARIQLETTLIGASNAERERQLYIFERINELQAEGVTITDQMRAAVEAEAQARFGAVQSYDAAAAAADRLAEAQERVEQAQQEIAGAFQGALKGLITDLVHGKDATEALYDAVSRLADRLLDIALDMMFQSLFSSLGGGLGGGGLLAGLFHTGGKAGAAIASRTVHPAVFANAPRMHNGGLAGLKPGEVPIIAKQGEVILPRSKVNSLSKTATASPNVDARTTVINRFDAASFISEGLAQPEGVKVLLNVVRSQPGAFRSAING
jgi:LAS superfamily LD-carboxypeptidase LdcB